MPPPPGGSSTAVIIVVVVVIVIAAAIIAVLVVLILCLYFRNKRMNKKGLYSPGHFSEHGSSLGTNTMELKYSRSNEPDPMSSFSPAALQKEAEAEAEAELEAAQPVSTTPTEGTYPSHPDAEGAVTMVTMVLCYSDGQDEACGHGELQRPRGTET